MFIHHSSNKKGNQALGGGARIAAKLREFVGRCGERCPPPPTAPLASAAPRVVTAVLHQRR
jgi:hypothetical protein